MIETLKDVELNLMIEFGNEITNSIHESNKYPNNYLKIMRKLKTNPHYSKIILTSGTSKAVAISSKYVLKLSSISIIKNEYQLFKKISKSKKFQQHIAPITYIDKKYSFHISKRIKNRGSLYSHDSFYRKYCNLTSKQIENIKFVGNFMSLLESDINHPDLIIINSIAKKFNISPEECFFYKNLGYENGKVILLDYERK